VELQGKHSVCERLPEQLVPWLREPHWGNGGSHPRESSAATMRLCFCHFPLRRWTLNVHLDLGWSYFVAPVLLLHGTVVFKQGAWASRETRDFPEIRCKIV
jgi:hypothetical protein